MEEMEALKKLILQKLIRGNVWGGKHTPIDFVIKGVPEHYRNTHKGKKIVAEHPGFRKRYPRGSFWSQYEHHQSIGWKSKDDAENYIRNQLRHHNVKIIDDRQKPLADFIAS